MKIGKIEITKKKIIICGVVALTAIISAGVIFACNKKNTPEVAIDENAVVQTQDANTEEHTEQNPTEVNTNESKSEVKNETKNGEPKSKEKKETVKENKSKKDNNQPNLPEVKTDVKVEGDQVILNADGEDGSSKTVLTFNGDKLSKIVLEMNASDEKMLKEIKEFHEIIGGKILEFNGKSLKVEMNSKLVEEFNKEGKKQDIIDSFKQFSENLKG